MLDGIGAKGLLARLLGPVALIGLVSWGCGVGPFARWAVPSQDDPATKQQARQVARLLEADPYLSDGYPNATCKVRVLGRDDEATYVWAACGAPIPGGGRYGTEQPVRVEGEQVMTMRPGETNDDDVREMFPPALAEMVLDRAPEVVGP